MAYTLNQTINWTAPFIQYVPQTAGLGQEPAVSIASAIRNMMLAAPFSWAWNRAEDSSTNVTNSNGTDYTVALTDFGYLEKATLKDAQGNVFEIKDIYNHDPLSISQSSTAFDQPQRPNAIAVLSTVPYTSIKIRLMGLPDQNYTLTLTYQRNVPILGPFIVTSCNNSAGGNTVYNGTFDTISFPTGNQASVTGFVTNPGNNGTFTIVSVTATTLTLANGAGVAETASAFVSNFNWSPIPDDYMNIYNWLYLGEIMAFVDDARSTVYRQRGAAALLAKAQGLTESQKNIFMQQWLAESVDNIGANLKTQQGHQARLV